MTTFKARGLVLREYEAGESDKRLLILCKGTGLLMVYAKGARKVKSKFLAASQILTYGDYVLADGGKFKTMTQAEIIENFYPIRQDYDRLCRAQYVIEFCEKTIQHRTPCDDLLKLVLKTLQHISKDTAGAPSIFLFRFFLLNGVAPQMGCCCMCGATDKAELFCEEGLLCLQCRNRVKGYMPLSLPARDVIRYVLGSDLNKAFLFKTNELVLREIRSAANLCRLGHFDIVLQTEI